MKKIIAFILTLSMLLSMVFGAYAGDLDSPMSDLDLKKAIAGIWGDTGENIGDYGKVDGTFGLDDAYQHTSPRQKEELQRIAALFVDEAVAGVYPTTYKNTAPGELPVTDYDFLVPSGSLTIANTDIQLAVKFFADAMLFARAKDTIIKNPEVTPTPDWTLTTSYPTLVDLTKRFESTEANEAFAKITNDKMNTAALGAFLLHLRDEFMTIVQDELLLDSGDNAAALFSDPDESRFVGVVKEKYARAAIVNILENALNENGVYDANLKAMAEAMIYDTEMLTETSASIPTAIEIEPDSNFVEMALMAFDYIEAISGNSKTTATVCNIILCGVLDNYVTVSSPAGTRRPNDGLSYAYNSGVHAGTSYNSIWIDLPIGTSVSLKVMSEVNYGIGYTKELDLTGFLIPKNMTGVTVTKSGDSWVLMAPSIPAVQPVLRFDRDTGTADGSRDISDLYMEIGLRIYDPSAGGTGGGSGGTRPTGTPSPTPIIVGPGGETPTPTYDVTLPDSGIAPPGTIITAPKNSNPDQVTVVPKPENPEDVTVNEDGSITINEGVSEPQVVEYEIYVNGELAETRTRIFFPETLLKEEEGKHQWYLRGYEDNTMRAEASITRAEVVTALYRLMSDSAKANNAETHKYTDVEYDAWYGMMVATMTNLKIVNGYDDGSFKPNAPITRAELSKVISYFMLHQLSDSTQKTFTDVDASHWAAHYIDLIATGGIIEGYPDNSFRPNEPTKRVEFATMVNRLAKRKVNKDQLENANVVEFDDLTPDYWGYAEMMEAAHSHSYERILDELLDERWPQITDDGIDEVYNK